MITLFNFSKAIQEKNKAGDFSGSLKYFKENKAAFSTSQIGANPYITRDIILALTETGRQDTILTFMEQFGIRLEGSNCLFLMKKLKSRPQVNWKLIAFLSGKTDPQNLKTSCIIINTNTRTGLAEIELASELEEWYSIRSKALFETGRFEECLAVSKEALNTLSIFHYSNDTWFSRRIALSLSALGHYQEAVEKFEKILKIKKEWFIEGELAEAYYLNGDTDKALLHALNALNNRGKQDLKVNLIFLSGKLLLIKEDPDRAFQHFQLAKLIRRRNGWSDSYANEEFLRELKVDEITPDKENELLLKLQAFWEKGSEVNSRNVESIREIKRGEIKQLLHKNERGVDGFLISDDGRKLYFSLHPNHPLYSKVEPHIKVNFKTLNDRKTNRIFAKILSIEN